MITLEAEPRRLTGKAVKQLRKQDLLPAVLYGAKTASEPIMVPLKSFKKVLAEAGESTLIALLMKGKEVNVLIHDVLRDPLTEAPLHADFLAVQMDKEVRTNVPLEFMGEAPAIRVEQGVLVKVMHDIEISALPVDLPSHIKVNLAVLLHIHDRLVVENLNIPQGVKVITPGDEVVVLIEAPRSEEELKALETAEPAATVEVMTEAEIKKKVEDEAAAATGEIKEVK
ncbi:MAG: 50S ribosomal protein L25 [Candidatus Sungbacteria bacterium]|uniref:Large ribosomal subunit protein bL25 n=1 Tax=Candidatus Sungiibacteriota bacterium TaxID=2750080 RepID=A0A9D6LRB9_9BACT|nr:50S ribosomal protein L25 [Candidatus Sungbacteria bacterium]